MDLEEAVIGVGLARKEALELASAGLGAKFFEPRLGLGDDRGLAFGLAQLDQLQRLVDLALDAPIALDRLVEPGALAQQLLRGRRILPQARVLSLGVQLGEASGRGLPVKDASSAAPTTS
jgi:hypothetical protein